MSVLLLTFTIQLIVQHQQVDRVVSQYTAEIAPPLYVISAIFDETMTIQATQTITIRNNHQTNFDHLYFHIYPNAFKNKGQAPFEVEEKSFAYPNGFNPGWIEIKNVKENNQRIYYKVMGDTNTVLRITPKKPLEPEKDTVIQIEFEVQLPNAIGRMGYGEDTVNITNWYPILAVYDEHGWNLDPYYPIGDPFYSEVATYEVKFGIPSGYQMASTGNLIKEQSSKNENTYWLKAENVRDFAIILSKGFSLDTGTVDGIEIRSYTVDEAKRKEALQFGIDSIAIFNRLFGMYPYQQISIVASDFHLGGMEYPNLVMISKDLYQLKEDFPLEYVIAHEVAHQWWYGIVGNNEVKEPWLDEAITEYATLMYFEEKYGEHIKEQILEKMIQAQYENFINLEPDKGEGILRSLKEFDNSLEYSSIVYSKGALFIEALRKEMGDEAFLKSMQKYYQEYKFKNATTEMFYKICEENTSNELKQLFEEWLKANFE